MFKFRRSSTSDDKGVLNALERSLAIIEFDPNGKVLSANDNFCNTLGYSLSEIQGKHHSMFVDPDYVRSPEYKEFWAKLGRGEFDAREYKRIGKNGREVWIQASYNPVINSKGVVTKVVKVATDVTARKLKNAEFEGKINAIERVQAVIEFTPNGEIITANNIFLDLLGYRLDEVEGKHHSIFVDKDYANSDDYRQFWKGLNDGKYVNASFKRIGKGGKEVWIQGSYNPIFDMNNKVMKVVKFANDITDLTEIGDGLARLAAKDLEKKIEKPFIPAFEKLRLDFNSANENLRTTLLRVFRSSNTIHTGTREISKAADDLSQRTGQQASSLEETAAAIEEITATVKKSAEGATNAREVVAAADSDGKQSSLIVRQAVEAMDAIAKSAQKISQIIGVIDEIAFQTNLLALNAGVEAARAGDAGRGFAVVASEVRALAQRSAEAAKEIKGLISASTAQVEQGVKLVGETGKSLERMLGQVSEINGIISAIACAAGEQASGLTQVNQAVNQLDQITQQNAAIAEQSTAAGHSLAQETEGLTALVGQFQLGESGDADAIRGELQKVAPHAFRGPPKVGSRTLESRGTVLGRRNTEPVQRPAAKVVNGAATKAAAADGAVDTWEEF